MTRTVNIRISEIEDYNLYFDDPEHQLTHGEFGLFFWKDPKRKHLGKNHVWLEIMSRDCALSELQLEHEIRAQLVAEGHPVDDCDAWITYLELCLSRAERRFDPCVEGSPRPHARGCRHIVPHWDAYTPAAKITVSELHATVEAFMSHVVGWQTTQIFHIKMPTLPERRATWLWYQRTLRGEE